MRSNGVASKTWQYRTTKADVTGEMVGPRAPCTELACASARHEDVNCKWRSLRHPTDSDPLHAQISNGNATVESQPLRTRSRPSSFHPRFRGTKQFELPVFVPADPGPGLQHASGPGEAVQTINCANPSSPLSSYALWQVSQARLAHRGREELAQICASFILDSFDCPDTATLAPTPSGPTLTPFIAHILHRMRLSPDVTFAALLLLRRLKMRYPLARASWGHGLFISALMLASKVICDDTYSNKAWCAVGQGLFTIRSINQMERELCSHLHWDLNFPPSDLADFETEILRDYGGAHGLVTPPLLISLSASSSHRSPLPQAHNQVTFSLSAVAYLPIGVSPQLLTSV